MSKMSNQVLIIEPKSELKFKVDFSGRFEEAHTTYMQLTNPSSDTVLFKIKTTAPKKYCVRPNSGLLKPNSKIEIAITPQPVLVDCNEKNKHKFMVQSVIAPEGKTNIDQVWKEISPDQLMDYKLRCVFEKPLDTTKDSGDNEQNDAGQQLAAAEPKIAAKGSTVQSEYFQAGKEIPDDNALVAPKMNSGTQKSNLEIEMQKIVAEMARLKEEDNRLKYENIRLKEDLHRLHQGTGGGEGKVAHNFSCEKLSQMSYMPYVVTAIGMVIVGIVVGKFIM